MTPTEYATDLSSETKPIPELPEELLAEYIEQSACKSSLELELKSVKDRLEQLEPKVIEHFTDTGTSKVTRNGYTVYLNETLWAKLRPAQFDEEGRLICSAATSEDVTEALKACGLGQFVSEKYNTQTLSAQLREWERDGVAMPPELAEVLTSSKVHSARVRKA